MSLDYQYSRYPLIFGNIERPRRDDSLRQVVVGRMIEGDAIIGALNQTRQLT